MAKVKNKGGVPNKHLHARVAYLHEAAEYFANLNQEQSVNKSSTRSDSESTQNEGDGKDSLSTQSTCNPNVLSVHLNTHMCQVARKAQIRLSKDIKHSVCKRCSSSLSALGNYRKYIENLSTGSKKPHADVLVLECTACAAARRFPVGAARQKRKTERSPRPEQCSSKESTSTEEQMIQVPG